MTKRDHRIIAEAIRDAKLSETARQSITYTMAARLDACASLMRESRMFDRAKFIDTCFGTDFHTGAFTRTLASIRPAASVKN